MRTSLLLGLFGLLFFSCDEEQDFQPTTVTEATADRAAESVRNVIAAQQTLATGYDQTQYEARQEGGLEGNLTGGEDQPVRPKRTCPGISFSTTPDSFFPATLGLDFGTSCRDEHGTELAGRLNAVFDGLLLTAGTRIGLQFTGFTVNETSLTGDFDVRNAGLDDNGRQTFTSTVESATFLRNGEPLLTYAQDWSSVQVDGQNTDFWNTGLEGIVDDVFEERITASGELGGGDAYSITTLEPVVAPIDCAYRVSGKVRYRFAFLDGGEAVLDYGDGSCDNLATLTVGAFTYDIEL